MLLALLSHVVRPFCELSQCLLCCAGSAKAVVESLLAFVCQEVPYHNPLYALIFVVAQDFACLFKDFSASDSANL